MTSRMLSAFLLVSFTLTGCSGKKDGDKKEADNKAGDKKDGSNVAKPLGKPDFTLKSTEYGLEFKSGNSVAAQKKYKDKVVELTGTLTKYGVNPEGKPILWMENAKGEILPVQCMTASAEPWKKALPGQTVTVKGKGPEFALGAALIECEIVEAKGDAPKTQTPDQVAEEYGKGSDAFMEKNEKKVFVVEGEIAKIDTNMHMLPEITLKTAKEKPRVWLHFMDTEGKRAKEFKVGQKIKAMGEVSTLLVDKDAIGLFDTVVIDPAR